MTRYLSPSITFFLQLLYFLCSLQLGLCLKCKSNEFSCRMIQAQIVKNVYLHQQLNIVEKCISKSNPMFCDNNCDCLSTCEDEPASECKSLREQCNQTHSHQMSSRHGWITPMGSEHGYSWYNQCTWVIKLFAKERVELHIKNWKASPGDRLIVYDATPIVRKNHGSLKVLPILMQLHGGQSPTRRRICSRSNKVLLIFQPSLILNAAQISSPMNRFPPFIQKALRNRLASLKPPMFNISWRPCGSTDCVKGDTMCPSEPGHCYTKKLEQCDGVWDCPTKGTDEMGCGNCNPNEFSCGVGNSMCYSPEKRCDGHAQCFDASDEKRCSFEECGPKNGTYLCPGKEGRCIYQRWICDGSSDCPNGEDEQSCPPDPPSLKLVLASVVGSLMCGLLLVISLGYMCRVMQIRRYLRQQAAASNSCGAVPRPALWRLLPQPPPPYDEAMRTSRPYEEVRAEVQQQQQQEAQGEAADDQDDVPLLSALDDRDADVNTSDDVRLLDADTVDETDGVDFEPVPVVTLNPTTLNDETDTQI